MPGRRAPDLRIRLTRPGLSRFAPLATVLVGVAVARLAPWPALALAGAVAVVVAGGAALAVRLVPQRSLIAIVVVGSGLVVVMAGGAGVLLELLRPPGEVIPWLLALLAAAPAGWHAVWPMTVAEADAGGREDGAAWLEAAALFVAVATGVIVAVAGPYFPSGWDGPFHVAALRSLLDGAAWAPVDPFFGGAGPLPVPQYGLDPWYPLLAVLARLAGLDALDTVRHVPPALTVLAVLGLFAVARTATARSGLGVPGTAGRAGIAAIGVALLVDGALGAGFTWRTLILPGQVAGLVLVPAALVALWSRGRSPRSGFVLIGALAAIVATVHLEAGALIGAVALAELVMAVVAGSGSGEGRGGLRAALRSESVTRPGAAISGVVLALVVTLPPLVSMAQAAGPGDLGNPAYGRHLVEIGPWLVVEPGLLLGSGRAVVALVAALAILPLAWRRPGLRALAGGIVVGWVVPLLPPLATLVHDLAGPGNLRRLAGLPAELAVPLTAVALVVISERLAQGRGDSLRRLVAAVPAALIAVALLQAVLTIVPPRAGLVDGPPPWLRGEARRRFSVADDGARIRALVAVLAPYLPPRSMILADPWTAYVLPAVLDVRVVAVPAVHSISTDPARISVRGDTQSGRDATAFLGTRTSEAWQLEVMRLYGVDRVVLGPAASGVEVAAFGEAHAGTLEPLATGLRAGRLAVFTARP